MVGRNSSLSISFTAPQLLVANDVVVMSLRTNSLGLVQLTTYSIIGISVNSDGLTASSLNYSQINMTFNGDTSISAGTDAILNLGLFAQPIVNSGVRYLDFTFYRGASFASGSVSLTVIPNVLQQVTLVPHTLVVSQVTTYTFTILTTNTIDVSGSIVITLPTDVSIANGACSASMTSSSSSLNTCTCNAMNNVITLSSFNLLVLSGSSLITMAVDNIRNPTTTKLTGQFLLRTYYNSSLTTDPVDDSSATSLFFTPVAATIIQASIVPSNYQVYTSAVYTFTVRVNTLFPANGVLILYLPAEITVPASTPSVTVSWVYSNGTTVPAFSATCSVPTAQTYKSQPTNALTISQISASSLASGTTMTVAVNSLINPQSFKPSSSFGIVTMSPNGFEVEELGPILTVTMNVTNAFKILSATNIPASLVNGKAIVYSFLIQTAVPLSLNDLLRVQLATTTVDTQMILTSSNTCSQTYNGVTSVAICSPSGSYIFDLSLSIPVPKDGSFTISVDSIVLPRTLKQPGLITVWSYHVETPTNTKYSVSTLSFLPPNNNSPNVLKSITLSINTSPSQLNQQQQFTVTVTTTNGLYAGDYLVVVVPSSYSSTLITAFSPTVPYDSSELDQSLCASVLYFCSNYNGLRAYIKVE